MQDAAESTGGKESKFADDLSVSKTYPTTTSNQEVLADLRSCQEQVHEWGRKNRVTFDSGKEELAVLHHLHGEGKDFRLLGPVFDTKLRMHSAVQKLLGKARPKVQALLKTRRFYSTANLVNQFKTHVLCVLESCTAAVYHAADTTLEPLDRVLTSFLKDLGLSAAEAFLHYNLAPLALRRDLAMLGLLHKCNLGLAHPQLQALYPQVTLPRGQHRTRLSEQRHGHQLLERCKGHFLETTRRSVFGLVRVYNFLPEEAVSATTVEAFQATLTALARHRCARGEEDWEHCYSPRRTLLG